VTNAAGYSSRTTTDLLGRVVASWAPAIPGTLEAVTQTKYDALGRVTGAIDSHGSVTYYSYNDQYRRVDVTAATGTAVEQVTTSFSDPLGRTVEAIDPRGLWLLTLYDDPERRVQQQRRPADVVRRSRFSRSSPNEVSGVVETHLSGLPAASHGHGGTPRPEGALRSLPDGF